MSAEFLQVRGTPTTSRSGLSANALYVWDTNTLDWIKLSDPATETTLQSILSALGSSGTTVMTLATDQSATGAGTEVQPTAGPERAFQAKGSTTSGTGSATIVIEGTNDTSWPYVTFGTITLTLNTSGTQADGLGGFTVRSRWKYVRSRVTAISGTGAKVSVCVGVGA